MRKGSGELNFQTSWRGSGHLIPKKEAPVYNKWVTPKAGLDAVKIKISALS
jgi:hypothetical protein